MADLSSETEMNSHAGDLLVCCKIYFFLAFPGNSKKTFSPFFTKSAHMHGDLNIVTRDCFPKGTDLASR